ncbi:response regulator [Sphingosinicellaceae bacterium]|nr:response regulator [Sphingosinicellaceae bacterium]
MEKECSPVGIEKTILVVEDEFLIRYWVADFLRDEGYNVLEALNGDEAVAILESGVPVDILFSDVRMPGKIDGLGLLAYVQEAHPSLPVVMASGHLINVPYSYETSTLFLQKPYTIAQVERAINTLLPEV